MAVLIKNEGAPARAAGLFRAIRSSVAGGLDEYGTVVDELHSESDGKEYLVFIFKLCGLICMTILMLPA